jgi:hypothetical protein
MARRVDGSVVNGLVAERVDMTEAFAPAPLVLGRNGHGGGLRPFFPVEFVNLNAGAVSRRSAAWSTLNDIVAALGDCADGIPNATRRLPATLNYLAVA